MRKWNASRTAGMLLFICFREARGKHKECWTVRYLARVYEIVNACWWCLDMVAAHTEANRSKGIEQISLLASPVLSLHGPIIVVKSNWKFVVLVHENAKFICQNCMLTSSVGTKSQKHIIWKLHDRTSLLLPINVGLQRRWTNSERLLRLWRLFELWRWA